MPRADRPASRSSAVLFVAALAVYALGCGAGEDLRSASASASPGAAAAQPFHIVATDSGFIAPTNIPAGIRHIVFENHGRQIHESMLVKLPPGMSPEGYVTAVKGGNSFPPGGRDYSGPGLLSPGETTELWLRVDPGRYILISWNGDDATSFPVHPFTVRTEVVDDQPPREDLRMRLVDYHFELEGELRSGVQVIRIETSGPSMHEADLFRLDEGRTLEDVNRWRKADDHHVAAPARALGGVLDSHDITHVVWLRKRFTPGRYVLHCEMPMNQSGVQSGNQSGKSHQSHADLGMSRLIEIPG